MRQFSSSLRCAVQKCSTTVPASAQRAWRLHIGATHPCTSLPFRAAASHTSHHVAAFTALVSGPLATPRRHKSTQGISHTRGVQYVSNRAMEAEAESSKQQDNDGEGEGTAGENGQRASNVEPAVVDFTTDVPPEKLDRLYHRANKGTRFLSSTERRLFTKMIYDKFYKDEGTTAMDPAMLYQASLEIQWVEEWMASVANERSLSDDDARREVKKALLERVDLHKPLSYIIGSQPFFGCDIQCAEPLLCPRPETEMWTHWLVYNYLKRVRGTAGGQASTDSQPTTPLNILDVCCGTGCIGVALAKHVPSAVVTALDILPEAVAVSQANARRNGIPDARYKAIQSDMFAFFLEQGNAAASSGAAPKAAATADRPEHNAETKASESAERPLGTVKSDFAGTFDVIVSNPPYVLPAQYVDLPRTITHWESKTALVGDDYRESRQYLYFKELCVHGAKLLKPRHMRPDVLRDTPNMLIEVGLQAHMVADLMEKSELWKDVSIHLDYAQQERWVSAVSTH